MKKNFALCFLFFLAVFSNGQTLIENGDFDDVSYSGGCTFQNGQYVYAFQEGCLGPNFGSAQGSPSVAPGFAGNGATPVSSPNLAFLYIESTLNNPCLRESFYYDVTLSQNTPYVLSFFVRGANISSNIHVSNLEVYATKNIENYPPPGGAIDCGINVPAELELIVAVNDIVQSDPWMEISVPFTLSDNYEQLWFVPTIDPTTGAGYVGHLVLDNLSLETNCPDSSDCEVKTDLTACEEEGDYGYIHLECDGASYNWSLPAGSNAFEVSCENSSTILNAGEGIYSVTITEANGCTYVNTYDVVADCCECPAPVGLDCSIQHSKIYLSWTEIPGATYDLTITTNDIINCGCSGTGGSNTITISDITSNYYYLNPSTYSCFSWSVSANCANGLESENSLLLCYSEGECTSSWRYNENSKQKSFRNKLNPHVYPNPSSGSVNLELTAPGELTISVEVYSLNGMLVKSFREETHPSGSFNKNWIIEEQLNDGLYFVYFKTNFGTFQKKVVISKNSNTHR